MLRHRSNTTCCWYRNAPPPERQAFVLLREPTWEPIVGAGSSGWELDLGWLPARGRGTLGGPLGKRIQREQKWERQAWLRVGGLTEGPVA